MNRVNVNPGTVEWAGDFHSLRLIAGDDGMITGLGVFVRAALSPHGRGVLALVLGSPHSDRGWPMVANLLLTDNLHLSTWLMDGFIRNLADIGTLPALDSATWKHLDSLVNRQEVSEGECRLLLQSGDVRVEMGWHHLSAPLPIEARPENCPTGRHEMYGVMQVAEKADMAINNTRIDGKTCMASQYGRMMSTSYLGYSTSWVLPRGEQC